MKLSIRERVCYALGDVGINIVKFFISFFLMVYLTDIVGMSPIVAGNIMMVCKIWDAVNDPMMAVLCDRTRTKRGVYRPWMFAGILPYAIVPFFIFTVPNDASMTLKTVYVAIFYLLYGMSNTVFQIPYSTMSNVMTTDSQERVVLGTFRDYGAKIAGTIITMVTGMMILQFGGGVMNARGYSMTGLVYSIVALVVLFMCTMGIKERVVPEKAMTFKEQISSLKGNTPALYSIVITFLLTLYPALQGPITVYYILNYVGSPAMISPLMTINGVAPLVSMLFVPVLVKRFGKKKILVGGCVGLIISGFVTLIAGTNIALVFVAMFLRGFFSFGQVIVWGMIPDACDYGEWKSGIKAPAIIYSGSTFAIKLADALAASLSGFMLTAIGYNGLAEVQTAATQTGLFQIFSWIPVVTAIICIPAILAYRLDEGTMAGIRKDLDAKRAAVGNPQ